MYFTYSNVEKIQDFKKKPSMQCNYHFLHFFVFYSLHVLLRTPPSGIIGIEMSKCTMFFKANVLQSFTWALCMRPKFSWNMGYGHKMLMHNADTICRFFCRCIKELIYSKGRCLLNKLPPKSHATDCKESERKHLKSFSIIRKIKKYRVSKKNVSLLEIHP